MSKSVKCVVTAATLWLLCFVVPAQAATVPFSVAAPWPIERWSFEPSFYDFGITAPGTGPSPSKAFTLTNTGEASLTPTWTGFTWSSEEPDPELFRITSDDCGTLSPGASCTIEVAFDPSRPGPKQGTLTVADVEPSPRGAIATTYFAGTGAGQVVSLFPESLRFEPVGAGMGPSRAQTVTVTNEGQLDLTISSVSLANYRHFDDDQFQLAGGTCAARVVLTPMGSCTVRVAFSPTAASSFSADLRIADNAPDSPQFATLEGTGVASPGRRGRLRALILSAPHKVTTKRRAVFLFKGSPSEARFECRLDSHPFAPCASPVRFEHLSLGRHHFAVRAIDSSGLIGRVATQYRWRIEARR